MKRLLLHLIVTTALITFSSTIQAQNTPSKQWDKIFGGPQSDGIFSLQQTTDGGYIFGGMSDSGIGSDKSLACQGGQDYWLVKTDANGNKLWDRTYGGDDTDILRVVQQTPDGGYILGGWSRSGISGNKTTSNRGLNDYWVIKIDANGYKTWEQTIGSNNDDVLFNLQQTSDGGYILAGYSFWGTGGEKTDPPRGDYDYWVVKLSATGTKQWDKTYGGSGFDQLHYVHQNSDGSYVLGGLSISPVSGDKTQPSKGSGDFWVLKIGNTGNILWEKTYGGALDDRIASMKQTPDGGFILGGHSLSGIGGDKSETNKGAGMTNTFDYWVVKIDAQGNKLWDKTLGGNNHDEIRDIQLTSDGGYLLAGFSQSDLTGDKTEANRGHTNYWLVKLDSSGTKQWDKTLGGSSIDILWSVKQTNDGGFICGGNSTSGISGDRTEANRGNGTDFWIVKLGPEVLGIKDLEENPITIYPNPSSGIITIELGEKRPTQVLVYNTLGQLVLTKNVVKTDNEEHIQLDLSNEAKGIYTIQVLSDKQVITRKVVLQ